MEGHVNRLKCLKRTMYGRPNLIYCVSGFFISLLLFQLGLSRKVRMSHISWAIIIRNVPGPLDYRKLHIDTTISLQGSRLFATGE